MDPNLRSKMRHRVSYETLIDHLVEVDLVLIGENHITGLEMVDGKYDIETTLNGVDYKNESRILEDLDNRGKVFRFSGEAVDGFRSPRKRELINRFGFNNPIHLTPNSTEMANTLVLYLGSEQILGIVGYEHLSWTQERVRIALPRKSISTVHQINDSDLSPGIYSITTIAGTNYVINGLLSDGM